MSSLRLRPTWIVLTTCAGRGVHALDPGPPARRDPDRGRARGDRPDPPRVVDGRDRLPRARVDLDQLVRRPAAGLEHGPDRALGRRHRAGRGRQLDRVADRPPGLGVQPHELVRRAPTASQTELPLTDASLTPTPDPRRVRADLARLGRDEVQAVVVEGADEDVVADRRARRSGAGRRGSRRRRSSPPAPGRRSPTRSAWRGARGGGASSSPTPSATAAATPIAAATRNPAPSRALRRLCDGV